MGKRSQTRDDDEYVHFLSGAGGAPCIARLAGLDSNGDILVQCDGSEAVSARFVKGLNKSELGCKENKGREVLLVFEGGNPGKPVVIGLMADPVEDSVLIDIIEGSAGVPKEASIDGKRVVIEGKEEIVLKCGKGSITITNDGKIVIKGTHLLARSSGPHRIKGARVDIN